MIARDRERIEVVTGVVQSVIHKIVLPVVRNGVGGLPSNILLNDDGTPIRNADGSYIYTR